MKIDAVDILTAVKLATDLLTQIYNAIQSGSPSVSVTDIQNEISRIKRQQSEDEAIERQILTTGHM